MKYKKIEDKCSAYKCKNVSTIIVNGEKNIELCDKHWELHCKGKEIKLNHKRTLKVVQDETKINS